MLAASPVDVVAVIDDNPAPAGHRGFDCDNGGEFLNDHLFRHFTNRKQPVQFTRSRSYHKNDNAHVEQRTGPTSDNGSYVPPLR